MQKAGTDERNAGIYLYLPMSPKIALSHMSTGQVSLISGKVKGHNRDMNTWLVTDWSKHGVYLHTSLQEYIKGPQKNKIANALTLKFVF